jgi:hypothetical protein
MGMFGLIAIMSSVPFGSRILWIDFGFTGIYDYGISGVDAL